MRPVNLRAARRALAFDRNRRPRPPRRRSWLLGILGLAGAAVLTWPWLGPITARLAADAQVTAGLALRDISIQGSLRLDDAQIRDALGAGMGTPILALDVHGARARIEALDWVASARLRRDLPDRLTIEITEHRPIAMWLGGEEPLLLAGSGATVRPSEPHQGRDLPRVSGADAPLVANEVERLLKVAARLGPVERLERVSDRRWRLVLADDLRIELPILEPVGALERLEALHVRDGLLDRALAAVDLRLADRLVVTPLPILRRSTSG